MNQFLRLRIVEERVELGDEGGDDGRGHRSRGRTEEMLPEMLGWADHQGATPGFTRGFALMLAALGEVPVKHDVTAACVHPVTPHPAPQPAGHGADPVTSCCVWTQTSLSLFVADGTTVEEFDTATGAVLSKINFPGSASRIVALSVASGSGWPAEEYLCVLTQAKSVPRSSPLISVVHDGVLLCVRAALGLCAWRVCVCPM